MSVKSVVIAFVLAIAFFAGNAYLNLTSKPGQGYHSYDDMAEYLLDCNSTDIKYYVSDNYSMFDVYDFEYEDYRKVFDAGMDNEYLQEYIVETDWFNDYVEQAIEDAIAELED